MARACTFFVVLYTLIKACAVQSITKTPPPPPLCVRAAAAGVVAAAAPSCAAEMAPLQQPAPANVEDLRCAESQPCDQEPAADRDSASSQLAVDDFRLRNWQTKFQVRSTSRGHF